MHRIDAGLTTSQSAKDVVMNLFAKLQQEERGRGPKGKIPWISETLDDHVEKRGRGRSLQVRWTDEGAR